MLTHRFGNGAEDDACLGKLFLEGRDDRDGIEHRIDSHLSGTVFAAGDARIFIKLARFTLLAHAGQNLLLFQRNAKFCICLQQFRVDLVQALRPFGRFRRGVIIEILKVDLGIVHARPLRLVHREPAFERPHPPFEHPVRLTLFLGNEPDDILVQALGCLDRLDVGLKTVLVFVDVDFFDLFDGFLNCWH